MVETLREKIHKRESPPQKTERHTAKTKRKRKDQSFNAERRGKRGQKGRGGARAGRTRERCDVQGRWSGKMAQKKAGTFEDRTIK